MKKQISVKRRTKESFIEVALDFNGLHEDYKKDIKTPVPFFNHMLEHIAYRSGMNLSVIFEMDRFDLIHIVFEDIGMALGKAVKTYLEENRDEGIPGFSDAIGIIDEAHASCALSFENRASFYLSEQIEVPAQMEGTLSEDLETFFEGFVQGAMCSLHLDINKGKNGHHIWEAAFRAFGVALRRALTPEESRRGLTSGVCGPIHYKIEAEE